MLIKVVDAKGNKDRYALLSGSVLDDLRIYYRQYRPKVYLFEGQSRETYSTSSIASIIAWASAQAGIKKHVTAIRLGTVLRPIFWKKGIDLRDIQLLLGHNSTKTTEIYTHVAVSSFNFIKNPMDV